MNTTTNPNGIKVNDEVTKGITGQVVYGVAKIIGADALCIKVYGTRARVRRIERIPLSDLYPV